MPEPPKSMRILCLGASLVAGYSSGGRIEHPFSQNLATMLRATMPGTEIGIAVDGVPGDLVTRGTFLKRMRKQCKVPARPGRGGGELCTYLHGNL